MTESKITNESRGWVAFCQGKAAFHSGLQPHSDCPYTFQDGDLKALFMSGWITEARQAKVDELCGDVKVAKTPASKADEDCAPRHYQEAHEAFCAGRRAFSDDGQRMKSVPYPQGPLHMLYIAGWKYGQKDERLIAQYTKVATAEAALKYAEENLLAHKRTLAGLSGDAVLRAIGMAKGAHTRLEELTTDMHAMCRWLEKMANPPT